uniref:Polymerase PB2 n=1 Tax=Lepidopteran orthomyxo-related virus OKIAV178 TaxID=2746278 RepID=A0A7D7IJV9_9ORTO|nr:polymerase PB2 [Lepidopteran orthomyxo-related virus OKIAV178]
METKSDSCAKSILLKASRSILKLSQSSLNIIKTRKMYHTKLIERSSRCTKDPNPLATTMILLNQKYPLAITKSSAKRHGVPSSYLCPGSTTQSEDTHMHDRVLARLSTLDWWINRSVIPSENLKRLAEVLFKVPDSQVETYYGIKWEDSRIKWGQPTLQRNLVRTNTPIVDIPLSLRNAAIKEVFFPEFSIPHPRLPSGVVEDLKREMNVILEDNMPLTKQLRILLNALDPRERYLPILPSSEERIIQIKHAVVHNNLVLVNYTQPNNKNQSLWLPSFRNLVSSIIYESKIQNIPTEEIKEICLSSTISNMDFMTMMESVRATDSLEFLWIKALFDRPTTLEHTRGSMTVCPDPREGREIQIYNKKMIPRAIKMGNQVVNFKYMNMRGKFVYNGQVLIEIVSNYTTARDLLSLLKEIAKYIGYRYQDTNDIRPHLNDRTIEKFVDYNPHKFLDCNLTSFSRIGGLKEGENCGKFRLQPNSEYLTTGCYHVTLDEKLDILLPGTQLKIIVDPKRESLKPFPDDVVCKNYRMIRCFNLKETIKEMFYFYLRNVTELIEKVRGNNFQWKNIYMRKFTGGVGKQMSYMARSIAVRLIDTAKTNYHYLCFIYCFCGIDPKDSVHGPLSYVLSDGTVIDMSAEQGIFVYSQEHNSYLLYGMKVGRGLKKINKADLLKGILEGYKIVHPAMEGVKLSNIRYLETQSHTIEEGESRNAYVGGTLYTFVKDSSINFSMRSTVNRHLEETIRRIESQGKRIIMGKRWLETEEFDYEHFPPDKKKRKIEEENIVTEYSDEVIVGSSGDDDYVPDDIYDSD